MKKDIFVYMAGVKYVLSDIVQTLTIFANHWTYNYYRKY